MSMWHPDSDKSSPSPLQAPPRPGWDLDDDIYRGVPKSWRDAGVVETGSWLQNLPPEFRELFERHRSDPVFDDANLFGPSQSAQPPKKIPSDLVWREDEWPESRGEKLPHLIPPGEQFGPPNIRLLADRHPAAGESPEAESNWPNARADKSQEARSFADQRFADGDVESAEPASDAALAQQVRSNESLGDPYATTSMMADDEDLSSAAVTSGASMSSIGQQELGGADATESWSEFNDAPKDTPSTSTADHRGQLPGTAIGSDLAEPEFETSAAEFSPPSQAFSGFNPQPSNTAGPSDGGTESGPAATAPTSDAGDSELSVTIDAGEQNADQELLESINQMLERFQESLSAEFLNYQEEQRRAAVTSVHRNQITD